MMKQGNTTHHNGETDDTVQDRMALENRLAGIQHIFIVLSGKGGVGKSTVAVNLAMALTENGYRVGLLDIDIHGPSIPSLLGMENETLQQDDADLLPVELGSLKVMSIGFMLRHRDDAVIWRGPMKMGIIRQFLKDVAWGELDYLIIDSPPGTGDEPLSICQLIPRADGAIVVTTPQKIAAMDVRRSITFCRRLNIPVLGVIENMSGFACPHCGTVTQILPEGYGREIAADMDIPFLGALPMDPEIAKSGDDGQVYVHRHASSATAATLRAIVQKLGGGGMSGVAGISQPPSTGARITIAVPLADGKLSRHFGHCARFALVDVDENTRHILGRTDIDAPPHEPGRLPAFLAERGVRMILAGGMGQRAQDLFSDKNIRVLVGAPVDTPEKLVTRYLNGSLQQGANICDH